MKPVTVSPKYQIVIPRNIRDSFNLKPGRKVHVIAHGDRIELIPERQLSEMRGFLKGMNTQYDREEDRL